jgi:hypothetical protein
MSIDCSHNPGGGVFSPQPGSSFASANRRPLAASLRAHRKRRRLIKRNAEECSAPRLI